MKIEKLRKGDTIGFFSPSTPITALCPTRFERGKSFLEQKGFRLKPGSLTNKKDFYRSGSINERAEELNELIRDDEVRCIISTIGGTNSNALLPFIDYEYFKNNPKIIIGYSDVTAILMALYSKTGIPTYYGPSLVASFGEFPPYSDMSFKYFEDILIKDTEHPYVYERPKFWTDEFIDWEKQNCIKKQYPNQWITAKAGKATGRPIIGNLDTMTGIWGSPYMPEILQGDVLFIEDSLKDAETIERSFNLLKLNNVFDRISGLVLGKHELFDDQKSGRKPLDILIEVLGDYNFPLLSEVDCCHTHPMFTMPMGGIVELDATNQQIKLISSV